MSTQTTQPKVSALLQTKFHNAFIALQGIVFVAASLHNDISSLVTNLPNWIPTILAILAYAHDKYLDAKNAYTVGETANVVQTASEASTIIANPQADKDAIVKALQPLFAAINVP